MKKTKGNGMAPLPFVTIFQKGSTSDFPSTEHLEALNAYCSLANLAATWAATMTMM